MPATPRWSPAVRNVHARHLLAPAESLAGRLDHLGGPDDELWPAPVWWPLRLTGAAGPGPAPGASGGHGPIRYAVEEYQPGQRVRFRFTPAVGLDGYHEFTLEPLPPADDGTPRCRLSHVIRARLVRRRTLVLWPLLIRPLHDALLEDLLDRAEQVATGRVARPARWSPWVRLCRALLRRQGLL
ncbi:MAG TPA: hypothetical protein VFP72_07480 [Kineosporiaceae bacterium]|nr:hypothetical protein [Kineosporiaceae bacterium]